MFVVRMEEQGKLLYMDSIVTKGYFGNMHYTYELAVSIIFLILILLLLRRYYSDDYYDYYVLVLSVVKRRNMGEGRKGPHKKDREPRALLNKRILFIISVYLLRVFYMHHNPRVFFTSILYLKTTLETLEFIQRFKINLKFVI